MADTDIKQQVVSIMGPTASGKTGLALALAEKLPAEIINVDSALVYRGLNIGAAKPSTTELAKVSHHLIDIRDPSEPYSAADFCRDARVAIEDILARKKTPILVGGTMLYFKALLEGLSDMPVSSPEIREAIGQEAAEKGWQHLHNELAKVDPELAANLHPNHSQRISRALEVYRISGRPMSEFRDSSKDGLLNQYDWRQIAIAPRDRSILHARIAERFDLMMRAGLLEEVRGLYKRGDLSIDLPAIRAVGYRQLWLYLAGEYAEDEMLEKALAATRQLAKRQFTWLRSWPSLKWIYTQDEEGKILNVNEILQQALNFLTKRSI